MSSCLNKRSTSESLLTLSTLADFAYASEVKKINVHLETIKTRCAVIQSTVDANNTKIQIHTFRNAQNDLAEKRADLQKPMEARPSSTWSSAFNWTTSPTLTGHCFYLLFRWCDLAKSRYRPGTVLTPQTGSRPD